MFSKKLLGSAAIVCSLMLSTNAFAQDNDWQTIPDNTPMLDRAQTSQGARIAAEIGGALTGAGITMAGSAIIGYIADQKDYYSDQKENSRLSAFEKALIISAIITPFVEAGFVHWAGSALDGQGCGWTPYAGGVIGGAVGAGLGAIGFIDSNKIGSLTTWAGAAAGAIIGAITWYEISHNKNTQRAAISNFHPVLEVNDRYTAMGVGFDF